METTNKMDVGQQSMAEISALTSIGNIDSLNMITNTIVMINAK